MTAEPPVKARAHDIKRERRPRRLTATAMILSVAIPAHNAANALSDTLDSLLAQTRGHRRAIIVDDGSTDERTVADELSKSSQRPVVAACRDCVTPEHRPSHADRGRPRDRAGLCRVPQRSGSSPAYLIAGPNRPFNRRRDAAGDSIDWTRPAAQGQRIFPASRLLVVRAARGGSARRRRGQGAHAGKLLFELISQTKFGSREPASCRDRPCGIHACR